MSTQVIATVQTIPLREATLCVSCETVTDAKNDHCPACSAPGTSLLSLAQVLNRAPDRLPEGVLFRLRATR